MADLFGIDIAGILNDAMGPGLLEGTLTQITPGVRTPGQLSSGTNPTEAVHTFRGFVERVSASRNWTLVDRHPVRVSILAASLPFEVVPLVGDRVEIDGGIYEIVGDINVDPATALYICGAAS